MKTKLGLLPGTVVYTGENNVKDVSINVIYYNENESKCESFKSINEININKNYNGNIWINISGINNVDIINYIGNMFNINSLSLEDIANTNQRVKIDIWDDYLHIILKMLEIDSEENEVNYEQLSIILKDNFLITFQEIPKDFFDSIRNKVLNSGNLKNLEVGYLAYLLIDKIVDNYLLIVDKIEDVVDDVEFRIMNNIEHENLQDILDLKQNMNILKKFISPVREIISRLQSTSLDKYFSSDLKYYLSDLKDHSIICFENIDILNNRSSELIQLYHSITSNNMNSVMKILAIISTIFMPITFICGLYGMNFVYMPELQYKYGYFITLIVMIILVVFMLIIFKKKKWL